MKKERFNSKWIGLISLSIGLLFNGGLSAQDSFGPLPVQQDPDAKSPTGVLGLPAPQDDAVDISPAKKLIPDRPLQDIEDSEEVDGQVMVNTKYAGWQEASVESRGIGINNILRGNWIMVDPNGRFDGIVTAAEGADVTDMKVYLLHMGRLVKQTTLDSNGQFVFNNVREGGYSLIGWGTKGFFAFGFNILANNPGAVTSVQSSVNVTAFQNRTTINTDWIRFYAPGVHFRVFGNYWTGEEDTDPPSLFGTKGLVQNFPESVPATSISSHVVTPTEDGRLVGRVHQLNSIHGRPVDVRSTKVMLFEGDSVVASSATDNYGVFEFHDVPDGSYGLLAVGVDGVGLIAINVGSDDFETNEQGEFGQQKSNVIDFTMVSSETIGWMNHYATEVAYRRQLLAPRNNLRNNLPYYCPNCGNQAGGCGVCQGLANYYLCRNRAVSFDEWAQKCNCPKQKPKPYGSELPGSQPSSQ